MATTSADATAPTPSPPSSGRTTPTPSPQPSVRLRSRMSVREVRPDSLSGGEELSADVAFMIRLKSARGSAADAEDDLSTLAPSECSVLTDADTDATLVDERSAQQLEQQLAAMERDARRQRRKIERLERRNRELLDREAGAAAAHGSTEDAERVRLLHSIHRLTAQNDDLLEEKRSLEQTVQQLSSAAQHRSPSLSVDRKITDLRMRLSKAEALAEDLQEENDELKQQVTEMESEMDEIQDSFCEDQVEEYQDLKKQLEQANKNGRVIQFKLRKAERSLEEAQQENDALEKQLREFKESGGVCRDEVEKLKIELKLANEVSVKLGEEVEQLRSQGKANGGKPPMKRQSSTSDESRLLRELQDTLEREADLREQMRFAEQDAAGLRRKLVRVEEENDGLTLQLRKLATKNRRRNSRERVLDGDEGISEDMDELSPHELRIQLELNEMETATLRRKIEKVEQENEALQLQIIEMKQKPSSPKLRKFDSAANIDDPNAYYEQRINVLEEEMNDVRKKLIERERENDLLKTEMQLGHRRGRGSFARARSLDLPEAAGLSRMRHVQSCSPEHEITEEMDGKETPSNGSAEAKQAEQRGKNGTKTNGTNGTNGASLQNGGTSSDAAIVELRTELINQKQDFEDLTRKYELLEEDYVVSKAQNSLEKDQLDGEFTVLKHEYDAVQNELKSLKESHSAQEDQWRQEKQALEQRAKDAEKRWGGRADEISWKLEKTRLQETLREKTDEITRLEKAKLAQKLDIEHLRTEMERQLTAARAASSKSLEEENHRLQEEVASKNTRIDQLQEDLVELRAAHARLRESHRRVLRERDTGDRERTELVTRHQQLLRAAERQEARVTEVAKQIEKVGDLVPLVIKGSKLTGQREKDHEQLQHTVKTLSEAARELRDGLQVLDQARDQCPQQQTRRQRSYQRSASAGASPAGAAGQPGTPGTPEEPGSPWAYRSPYPSLPASGPLRPPSARLGRRAASMGLRGSSQDSVYHHEEGSVESLGPFHYQTLPRIKLNDDPNFDRVSTESTQSEIVSGAAAAVKKKGPLRGLLRGWSRARSVDTMGSNSELAPSPAAADAKAPDRGRPESKEASPAKEQSQHKTDVSKTEQRPKLKKKISQLFRSTSPSRAKKEEGHSELEAEQERKGESGKDKSPKNKSESKAESKTDSQQVRESGLESPTESPQEPESGVGRTEVAPLPTAAVPGTTPYRNPPVTVRTPLSLSPATPRSVSVSRPTTTVFSTTLLSSAAIRRAARRTAAVPKITVSPSLPPRAPLVFNSFTRARARFES